MSQEVRKSKLTTKKTTKQVSNVEEAQILLEKEKTERAQAFLVALEKLCTEFNCSLVPGQIMIQPN